MRVTTPSSPQLPPIVDKIRLGGKTPGKTQGILDNLPTVLFSEPGMPLK